MQKDNKFFDDMAKMMTGAAGSFMETRREMEAMMGAQVEKWLQKMNLATREEVETLRGMVAKLRAEQEELKQRLAEWEAKK